MSSIFYVKYDESADNFGANVTKTDSKMLKNCDSLKELGTNETRYNSERDIAYTEMDKTPNGNLHEVKSAENLSEHAKKKFENSVNYIVLDFHKCDQKNELKSPKASSSRKDSETLYTKIDFEKTLALQEVSRTKT